MKTVRLIYGSTLPSTKNFSSDLLWASRLRIADPFFLAEFQNGKKIVLVGDSEYPKVQKAVRAGLGIKPLGLERSDDEIDGIVSFLKKIKVKSVIVPDSTPIFVMNRLIESEFKVSSRDDLWFPERAIKEKREIEHISESQGSAERALGVVCETLKRSAVNRKGFLELPLGGKRHLVTAERLEAMMCSVLEEDGHTTPEIFVGCGKDSSDIHARTRGPIKAREPIVIDIFPYSRTSGYWGDMTRTFFKGKPSAKVQKMYVAVLGATEIALHMIRPGVCARSVYKEVVGFFEKVGYPEKINNKTGKDEGFIHALGHGVGVDVHEWPIICLDPIKLAEGMVLAIEPGLYYPKVGGIRVEDVVLVKKNGIKNLTEFPKDLGSMIL